MKLLRLVLKLKGAAIVLLLARAALGKLQYKNARFIWLLKRYLMWIFVRVLPIRTPEQIHGAGSTAKIAPLLKDLKCGKVLVVTDKIIVQHGLLENMLAALETAGLQHCIYDGVQPDPPIRCVEEGYSLYQSELCDSIVAFGGGSSMDTAKMIGAKVANPKPVPDYQGIFKVNQFGRRPLPPFIAVATTAGTGSEVSIGAVITNEEDQSKMVCIDLGLVPSHAVLDPEILLKLPGFVTAATGLDALTHATEAYMNGIGTKPVTDNAISATQKVFAHLVQTYHNGQDKAARQQMLFAAFEAGVAITGGHVGYVHAIAHQIGSLYHTPHGFACAIVLPHVLDFYLDNDGNGLTEQLSQFALLAGVVQSEKPGSRLGHKEIARAFIQRIRELCAEMKVPSVVEGMTRSDVPEVAKRAMEEAHGSRYPLFTSQYLLDTGYPVSMYMTQKQCEQIVEKILPA